MWHPFHPSLNQQCRPPRNSTLRSFCCRDIPHLGTREESCKSSLHPWEIWLLLLSVYFCLRWLLCPAWYRPSCRRRQPMWNLAVFPATTLFLFLLCICKWILMLVLVHRVLRKHWNLQIWCLLLGCIRWRRRLLGPKYKSIASQARQPFWICWILLGRRLHPWDKAVDQKSLRPQIPPQTGTQFQDQRFDH